MAKQNEFVISKQFERGNEVETLSKGFTLQNL